MLSSDVVKFQDQYYIAVDDEDFLIGCSTNKEDLENKTGKKHFGELNTMLPRHIPLYVLEPKNLQWYEIDDESDLKFAERYIMIC